MTCPPHLRGLPAVERQGWPWSWPDPPAPRRPETSWPRISIVVPSYNQARFLEETLRSIVLQAYPETEVLVADGASRDDSVEILQRYEPWLTWWTSEPDGGQSNAINKGFVRATGEILTFIGSDDVYEPETFYDVARQWSAHPECGAIVGAFRFIDEASRYQSEIQPPRLPGLGPHDLTLMDTASWRLHQVSTFYSRNALDTVGRRVREDLHYAMDRELLYRVCRNFPVVLTERTYACFRKHSDSKSTSRILPMMREMADLHLEGSSVEEDASVRRQRRALWRERRARGHVKLAFSDAPWWRRAWALLRAPQEQPSLLLRRHYLVCWLAMLNLLPWARLLRRKLLVPKHPSAAENV